MTKRICWKKGMRLTDEILRASDSCTAEYVGNALVLAAAGRFGLLPSSTPFSLSVDISQGVVTVESLTCLAVTRGGHLIDVHYDTKYTNTFDTRVRIPENSNVQEYILAINASEGEWNDTNDGFEEPVHSFSLFPANSPVPTQSMPVARLVNDYGWRLDEVNFVPPCLFVSSHYKYADLLNQFQELLTTIDAKIHRLTHSDGKMALRIFWPLLQQLLISTNKECDTMTPMALLANVQKFVSVFTCACELDDYLELSDSDKFRSYIYTPYNYKDSYQKIKEGLELSFSIGEKIERLNEVHQAPVTVEAPTIAASQLVKRCTNSKTRIQITNNVPNAVVYYTTDGEEPSQNSKSGLAISIDSGFNNSRKKEPDKIVIVKVKAVLNGVSSSTNTYEVTLQKDIERWTGIEI